MWIFKIKLSTYKYNFSSLNNIFQCQRNQGSMCACVCVFAISKSYIWNNLVYLSISDFQITSEEFIVQHEPLFALALPCRLLARRREKRNLLNFTFPVTTVGRSLIQDACFLNPPNTKVTLSSNYFKKCFWAHKRSSPRCVASPDDPIVSAAPPSTSRPDP